MKSVSSIIFLIYLIFSLSSLSICGVHIIKNNKVKLKDICTTCGNLYETCFLDSNCGGNGCLGGICICLVFTCRIGTRA